MPNETTGRWRWRNLPVPEPHVGGLLAGAVFHAVRPWTITPDEPLRLAAGGGLLLVGLGLVTWAVLAVRQEDVDAPTTLVTAGPYRYSRHPMYVGWTGLCLGVAVLANAAWPLAFFPVVAVAVHVVVRREERELEAQFDEAYRTYARDVRRYL